MRMLAGGSSVADRIRRGFELCLSRPPNESEVDRLVKLFGQAKEEFAKDPQEKAVKFAPPKSTEPVELAAWTTVANVLLNLDETLMKR
jgi:hypothetical protein